MLLPLSLRLSKPYPDPLSLPLLLLRITGTRASPTLSKAATTEALRTVRTVRVDSDRYKFLFLVNASQQQLLHDFDYPFLSYIQVEASSGVV